MANSNEFYDAIAQHYPLLYKDWDSQLEREGLSLRSLFRGKGVLRILDAACGAGTQTVALAKLGYELSAVDPSAGMLRQAQKTAEAHHVLDKIQFERANFDQLPQVVSAPFDALVCKGNALAHLLTDREIEDALLTFFELLRPGGILVIGIKDFSRFAEHRPSFLPGIAHIEDDGTEFITFERWEWQEGPPLIATQHLYITQGRAPHLQTTKQSISYRPLSTDEVKVVLAELGYEEVVEQFDRTEQLVIARRPLGS